MAESHDARLVELVADLGGGSNPLANRKTTAETPSGAWGLCMFVRHQATGQRLTPRRTPATPGERWFCELPERRTPHSHTWGRCSLRDRGAPGWGDHNRCNAVALERRREAEKSSAGTLLCDAHGKVATVEVGPVELGNRGVGAFVRLHLDEAEAS